MTSELPATKITAAERARLLALDSFDILDTAPEAVFDDIVTIAAEVCGVPMALISLVDSKRQWFKAALGISASETPREIAFCAHAIQQRDVLLVEDANQDERFRTNPLVTGDPNVRFYAGAPLVTSDGLAIGTLCVLDTQPRALTKTQHLALQALGRQVMLQLELRRAVAVKRADDQRNQLAEERLRRAQEAGGVGVFAFDFGNGSLDTSPQFCRLFGLDEATSISAATYSSMLLPEDRTEIAAARAADLECAPLDVEYRIRRADTGELRWLARRANYERDHEGKPVRLVGIVQDVTERRMAQRAAEESAAQFQTFAQALPNHVWTAPPSGKLDWFNDRVYEYSGLPRGSLDGDAWIQMVQVEDVALASQRWMQALEAQTVYETEFRLRDLRGKYRWHLARALPIRSADGAISRWVGTNTDIHEQKLAETQSIKDRDRIWALSQEVMLVCDFEGTVSAINPSATRVFGYSEEEMIGRRVRDFLHPEDVASTAAEIQKLVAGEATLAFENRYRAKDGSYRVLDWTAVLDGARIHAVARDITQQRQAEDALRQSQKMEAVGQLTGGIAHDFNNLLQGITGSLDLVKKRIAQGRIGDLDRFVGGAMASANRAAALTHRLLAFSRRQPLDPKALHANRLILSMEDLVRRTLSERIKLKTAMAQNLSLTRCDANQLENAILNLVINARDAMPYGGILTIETSNVSFTPGAAGLQQDARPGDYICIAVSDTGTGMSADTMSKAFEPFFTTKPIGQGTGLGLSMIYGFARQSDGNLKIYSELGRGSTVKLFLPRYDGEADLGNVTATAELPPAKSYETVLVVEDESVVRELIVEILRELGYRALEAADGPAGLAILQSAERIDLLISDIGLPGLNGRQISEAARLLRPSLKVLFMTGYAETAAAAAGFLEGGMAMITKPFAMEDLARRVRSILAPV